jgi:hypothetical protein
LCALRLEKFAARNFNLDDRNNWLVVSEPSRSHCDLVSPVRSGLDSARGTDSCHILTIDQELWFVAGSAVFVFAISRRELRQIELTSRLLSCVADATTDAVYVKSSETILLVEDQLDVRKLARIARESYGYPVIEGSDGQEALDLLLPGTQAIDLMLTDGVMPPS